LHSCCGAVAAERLAPPLSIDISCPLGAQQQTRRTPLLPVLRSIDGADRQMDGHQTITQTISVNKLQLFIHRGSLNSGINFLLCGGKNSLWKQLTE